LHVTRKGAPTRWGGALFRWTTPSYMHTACAYGQGVVCSYDMLLADEIWTSALCVLSLRTLLHTVRPISICFSRSVPDICSVRIASCYKEGSPNEIRRHPILMESPLRMVLIGYAPCFDGPPHRIRTTPSYTHTAGQGCGPYASYAPTRRTCTTPSRYR
jgi:hypothetical protein